MKGDAAFNRRVLRVFEDLLDRPPSSWAAWLDTSCADEPPVRDAVDAMISAHRSSGFLPTEPLDRVDPAASAVPPGHVGPYRIVREVGHGGMGVVYLAERADNLFDRKVAIKLMRQASLSERARAKFVVERQILGRLRHPHIAQMYDGGTTDSGAPYMVMEYIEGAPITDYCAANAFDLKGRLALFAQACAAVEFAHRNLIVHADIKPGNVVVEDRFGVKLLDFGVSRLLDGLIEADGGGFTRGYASPARLAGAPAIPADDIYSAGALLAELVAGQPGVDGDLEAIVAKAIEDDPDARYATVGALLDDLDRWRAHRPVSAAAPGRRRSGLLFWRRHRTGLTVAAALTLIVLVALVAVTTLYLQSERRRTLANRRYTAVSRMAGYIIGEADPGLAHVPGALTTRERMLRQTGSYLAELERDQDASPALRREIAAGYLRMARVYGLDPSGGVGELAQAHAALARANRQIESAVAADPAAPELLKLRGEAALLRANAIFATPSKEVATDSIVAARAAQAMLRRYVHAVPGDIDARLEWWAATVIPARAYNYLGRPTAGLDIVERNLVRANDPVHTPAQRKERDFNRAGSYLLLGEGYSATNQVRSLAYYNRLIDQVARLQRVGASDWELDMTQASGLAGRAQLEVKAGRTDAAIRDSRSAIAELRRLSLADDNHELSWFLSYVQSRLAAALADRRRFVEARRVSDASIAWLRDDLARYPSDPARQRVLFLALLARGALEDRAGLPARACQVTRGAIARSQAGGGRARMPIDTVSGGALAKAAELIARDC